MAKHFYIGISKKLWQNLLQFCCQYPYFTFKLFHSIMKRCNMSLVFISSPFERAFLFMNWYNMSFKSHFNEPHECYTDAKYSSITIFKLKCTNWTCCIFQMFVFSFFGQVHLKNSKQLHIQYSNFHQLSAFCSWFWLCHSRGFSHSWHKENDNCPSLINFMWLFKFCNSAKLVPQSEHMWCFFPSWTDVIYF